jgi:hypothetical protein
MNTNCEKTTAHSQNILHGDTLYNINSNKYKTVCAALTFAKVTLDRMVMILFYRIYNFFFFCYAVGLLQYSKNVWSKVGTPTVYIFIGCTLMPQNCIRSGKSCKIYAMFTMFPSSDVFFYISKQNNAIYMLGVPSLHHKHRVLLFIFYHFFT